MSIKAKKRIDGVNEQRTIIISEQIPTFEDAGTANEYYVKPTTISVNTPSAGYTRLTFSGTTWTVDAHIGKVILILTDWAEGMCFTIYDNTATLIDVYDPDGEITTGTSSVIDVDTTYLAIVHTASTMYDYCDSNDMECIAVTCGSVAFTDGSSEMPKSYADHITMRVGTGVYTQAMQFQDCEVWQSDPKRRIFNMNQIRSLMFKWHQLNNNNAVYLIVTVESISGSDTLCQNWNFFDVGDDAAGDGTVSGRGYLKGFPMGTAGSLEFSPEFSIQFKEAWLL